jgi:hypothetical protein
MGPFCHTAGAVRVSFQHKNVLMLMLERQPDATPSPPPSPIKVMLGGRGDRHKIWACWPTYVYISNVYFFSHRINEERGTRYVHKHAEESLRENVRFFINVSLSRGCCGIACYRLRFESRLFVFMYTGSSESLFSLLMLIRILFLIKVMRICDHWSTEQTLHGSI